MNVLITGITGFVGSRLASYFTAKGCAVAGLVRPSRINESENYYEYDGSFSSVKNAVDNFNPDVIIHLAATYSNNTSDYIDDLVGANISLPLFLLENTKNTKIKTVFAGSYWQFGNKGESKELDMYAASKSAADQLIEYYVSQENIFATVLYFYGTYGGDDSRGKILDYIIKSIRSGNELRLSPGEQILNLVNVDDVVSAFEKVISNDTLSAGKVHKFGVYSKDSYTLKELVTLCQKYINHPINIKFGAVPYRERELMVPQYPYPNVPDWCENMSVRRYIKMALEKNI